MEQVTPWFNPAPYGMLFGCLGGLYGALVGLLGPRGKARTLVMGLHWFLFAVGLLFLAAGLAALFLKQPHRLSYPMLVTGLVGAVVFYATYPMLRRAYAEAELRKSRAADL